MQVRITHDICRSLISAIQDYSLFQLISYLDKAPRFLLLLVYGVMFVHHAGLRSQ